MTYIDSTQKCKWNISTSQQHYVKGFKESYTAPKH